MPNFIEIGSHVGDLKQYKDDRLTSFHKTIFGPSRNRNGKNTTATFDLSQ